MYHLRVFGAVELRGGQNELIQSVMAQPKRAAVLIYLALASPRYVRRDTLLGVFWPDFDEEHARGALRTTLHWLRSSIGDALVTRGSDAVGIDTNWLESDALTVKRLLSLHRCEEALDLYRGEALEGLHVAGSPAWDTWLEEQRTFWRQAMAQCARDLCEQCAERGDVPGAIRAAQRGIAIDSTSESLLRRLIELQEANGDVLGALRSYQAFEQRLETDFDLRVSRDTEAVLERIRTAAAPLQPMPPGPRTARNRHGWLVAAVAIIIAAAGWLVGSQTGVRSTQASWSRVDAVGAAPIARDHHVLLYDQADKTLVLFGGRNAPTNFGDLWRVRFRAGKPRWEKMLVAEPVPRPRWMPYAAVNELEDVIIMHGGALGHTSPCTDETWLLEHMSTTKGVARWHRVETDGDRPAARADHRGGYDAERDRLIVHGGHNCVQTMFDDAWVLHNATGRRGVPQWHKLAIRNPSDGPGRVRTHSAVYDPGTNRLIIFGGSNGFDAVYNRVWLLTNANGEGGDSEWLALKLRGGAQPAARAGHSAVFDAATNRMVVFGGSGLSESYNDAWVLVGANGRAEWAEWHRLDPAGIKPRVTVAHPAAFDAGTESLIVFGKSEAARPAIYVLSNATGR